MPVWRITIEKYNSSQNEYWTNIYHKEAATIGDVAATVTALVSAERPLYTASTAVTKTRVDDGIPDTDLFVTSVFNLAGTRTSSTDFLPFYATARVDFSITGQGRPGRKYIRGMLTESDSNGLNVTAGVLTELGTYGAAVVTAGVCDAQGQAFANHAPKNNVQMRQLRRGSKKKVTP